MISVSVSQSRCRLKGASGHKPSRLLVALDSGNNVVSLCDGSCNTEETAGIASVRHVGKRANNARLLESIIDSY